MLSINKMKEEDSKLFYAETINDFIDANVECGKWTLDESRAKSMEHFNKQFPNGVISCIVIVYHSGVVVLLKKEVLSP